MMSQYTKFHDNYHEYLATIEIFKNFVASDKLDEAKTFLLTGGEKDKIRKVLQKDIEVLVHELEAGAKLYSTENFETAKNTKFF